MNYHINCLEIISSYEREKGDGGGRKFKIKNSKVAETVLPIQIV